MIFDSLSQIRAHERSSQNDRMSQNERFSQNVDAFRKEAKVHARNILNRLLMEVYVQQNVSLSFRLGPSNTVDSLSFETASNIDKFFIGKSLYRYMVDCLYFRTVSRELLLLKNKFYCL